MARRKPTGFTLTEVMLVVMLITLLIAMSYAVFFSGEGLWFVSEKRIRLQENLRAVLQKISVELRQTNSAQKNIFNAVGPNNSDSIRFSMPVICEAGGSLVDAAGDIAHWGAPLTWGCSVSTCMDADDDCASVEYKFLEYRMDAQNRLVRLVLNNALSVQRTDIIAEHLTDFQVAIDPLNNRVLTLTVAAQEKTVTNRVLQAQATQDVYLRND